LATKKTKPTKAQRNIPARQQAEAALAASEERFRALFENMQDGCALCQMVFDEAGRPVDFIYLAVNSAFGRLTGLENVVGKHVTEILPGLREAHPELLETYGRVARTGQPERFEIEFKPLAKWLTVSVYQTQPDHFAAMFDDITARKQTEETLRKSEARLAAFAGATFEGIVESEAGRILDCNEQFARMTGYTVEELRGMEIASLIPAADRERILIPLREAREAVTEATTLRKDGTVIIVESHGRQVSPDSPRRVSTVRDITAHKQAETALRESEARFRTMAETLPGLMWLYDAVTCENVFVNRGFCEFAGRAPAGLLGRAYEDVLHPGDVAALTPRFAAALAANQTFEAEYRFRRHDGQWRWHLVRTVPQQDAAGRVVQCFGMAVDITERKHAEDALAAAHRQTQSLIDNTTSMVYACDLEERFVVVNAALAALLKATPEQVIGKRRHEFMPQADADAHEANDQKVIAAGRAVEVEEHSDLHGRSFTWLSTKFPLRDAQGRIYGVAGIVTDITARKQAEEALDAHHQLLTTVIDRLPAGINIIRGRDLRIIMANPGYYAIAPGKTAIVGKTLDEIWPETGRDFSALCRRVLETGESYHVEDDLVSIQRQPAGPLEQAWFTWSLHRIRLPGEDGWGILNPGWETTARHQAEAALRVSEQRLALAIIGTRLGMFDRNLVTGDAIATEQHFHLHGLRTTTTTTTLSQSYQYRQWAACVHPEDLPRVEAELRRCQNDYAPYEVEYRVVWPDGSVHWLVVRGVFQYDVQGQPQHLLGIVMDITARKQAEDRIKAALTEKEVLLKEIHHRVKNNLQIMASLVSLQADSTTDDRVLAEFVAMRDRISAMACVHETLYQTNNLAELEFAEYAERLLRNLWNVYRTHGTVRLNLAIAPVNFPVDKAVSCGLLLSELATNALKYAFPNGRDGTVTVALEHEAATGAVCLRVQDDGVGLPAGLDWRQSTSLGLRLVNMLADQLGGTVETGPGPGAEFRISFNLQG